MEKEQRDLNAVLPTKDISRMERRMVSEHIHPIKTLFYKANGRITNSMTTMDFASTPMALVTEVNGKMTSSSRNMSDQIRKLVFIISIHDILL